MKKRTAGPEDEREELRQLTRELHEAAQNARDVARDLRAARKEIGESAEDQAVNVIGPLIEKLNETVREAEQAMIVSINEANLLIEDKHRELLGFADTAELTSWIATQITGQLAKPEYTAVIADKLLATAAEKWAKQKDETQLAAAKAMADIIGPGAIPGIVLDFSGKKR